MATPITWRNVESNGQGYGDFGRPMQTALLGLNTGFDKLTGVYDQYEKQQVDKNTNLFQNKLAEFTTPEALQAAQASGAIAALKSQYGLQMDQNVARNGERDLRTKLFGDATAANKYAVDQADFAVNTPDELAQRKRTMAILGVDQAQANVLETGSKTTSNIASARSSNASATGQELKNTEFQTPEAQDARKTGYQVTSTTNNEFLGDPAKDLRLSNTNIQLGDNANKKIDQQNTANLESAQTDLVKELNLLRSKGLSERDTILGSDEIVRNLSTRYKLPADLGNKLSISATASLNGTGPTGVRLQEQAVEAEMNKRIVEAASSQNVFYTDAQKPYNQKIEELHKLVDSEFNKNGWGDANPDNAKMILSKYIGQTVSVKDGDKTYDIPVTVELLRDSMNLGAKGERTFTDSKYLDPKLMNEKLKEAAQKPEILKAYRTKMALDSGNLAKIKEARGLIAPSK